MTALTWKQRAVLIAAARKRIELAERKRRQDKRDRQLAKAAKTRKGRAA